MNSHWIKMRSNLLADPDVLFLAEQLGIDEFAVVGRLHTFWSWADQHTSTGTLHRTSPAWIDRFVSCPGFSDALVGVGWLVVQHGSLILPEWDRHNGSSAKARARDAIRKKSEREYEETIKNSPANKCPEKSGQNLEKIRTRVEESREEKSYLPTTSASMPEESRNSSSNTSFFPSTDQPTPETQLLGNKEWMGMLKYSYPDRDVEGELKSFQIFCQKKGTAANRNGFIGWLKKASPSLEKIPESKPRYSY